MIPSWSWLKMNMRSKVFPLFWPLTIASAIMLCIALAATSNAHIAKVFMLGGSVAQENTEIYAGLRATTARNWNPDTCGDSLGSRQQFGLSSFYNGRRHDQFIQLFKIV